MAHISYIGYLNRWLRKPAASRAGGRNVEDVQHSGSFALDKRPVHGEPHFVLMGRDPQAPGLLFMWATERETGITEGRFPESDMAVVMEVRELAHRMKAWREQHDGSWRQQNPELPFASATERRAALYNGEV